MTDLPRIPLAGVIGHPIAHSRSPALHGFWLKRHGIKGHYIPMDVAPQDLKEALNLLPRLGFVGVNVTIPHKEAVLQLADIVTDRAALTGAANTLIFRKDGRLHADNTDGAGFMANLRQNAPDWNPAAGPAVVFGAGGAARAVIAALIEVGVPEIRLTNRSRPRAETLRVDFGAKVLVEDWTQWNKINITVTQAAIANPVNGRVDAQKMEAATSASTAMYQSCASVGLAAGNLFVVYAKAGSGSTDANRFVLRNSTTSTNLLWVTLNYSTGEITRYRLRGCISSGSF